MVVEHVGIETSNSTMEKLELLSATAALKQGIDGNNNSNGYSSRSNSNHCGEKVLVLDNSNRVVDGNLPSPVSIEDNETDDGTTATNVNIATKTNTLGENNSIRNNLGRTISRNSIRSNPLVIRGDTRSPVPTPTVEYRQIDAAAAAAQSSPLPFPFLPRQTTHHNHHLNYHHQQQQHDYAPSSYIVRSLSEASPVYGGNNNSNNSIPISSSHHHAATAAATAAVMSTSAVTNNNSEYDTNLHLQQQQHQQHHHQQQQQPPPSHLRLSIQHQQQQQQQQLHQHRRPSSQLSSAPSRSRSPKYEDMARQIQNMQEQLGEKDMVVSSLQHRVNYLENQIHELRQLPTGKISHIPVDDMIRIMQEYGSEVSNQTLPQQRKNSIKKASIVRQFRRWNPEFFRYFLHVNGEWAPKLGRDGELRRRAEKRRLLLFAKQQQTQTQETQSSCNVNNVDNGFN